MTERPLSHTKRGKLLAAAGGLAGGPLGVIVSPLVLMLINSLKKKGNRFLIWFLIGIPAAGGLLLFQILILLATPQDPVNGMNKWKQSNNAQELMSNPDWCIFHNKDPATETLKCHKRDWTTSIKNDHKKIECIKFDFREYYDECNHAVNVQFTDEEISKNKQKYGWTP